MCEADDAKLTLTVRLPGTGALAYQLSVPATVNSSIGAVQTVSDCPATIDKYQDPPKTGWAELRAQISTDDKQVVATSQTQPNGAVHVGYVDLATSTFKDISAQFAGQGYSDAPTVDSNPEFTAKGAFEYQSVPASQDDETHPTLYRVDLGTMKRSIVAQPSPRALESSTGFGFGNGTADVPFTPCPGALANNSTCREIVDSSGGPTTDLHSALVTKDFTTQVVQGNCSTENSLDCLFINPVPAGTRIVPIDDNHASGLNVALPGPLKDLHGPPCDGPQWLNASNVLCPTNDGGYDTIDVTNRKVVTGYCSQGCEPGDTANSPFTVWQLQQQPKRVLPPSDRKTDQVVTQQAGSGIAFRSTEASVSQLYYLPDWDTASSAPIAVPGVDMTDQSLLAWL